MKKNAKLILAPAALLCLSALAGCGEQAPTLGTLNKDAQFVASWEKDAHMPLATYELSNRKGLPYLEVGEFGSVMANLTKNLFNLTRGEDGTYTFKNAKREDSIFKVNPQNDTLEMGSNLTAWLGIYPENNGVVGDFGSPKDEPGFLVHTSDKSRVIGTPKAESYKMKDYGMDFVEQEGKLYMPAQLVANLMTRGLGQDFVLNGRDMYISSSLSGNIGNSTSFYSGNGEFALRDSTGDVFFKKIDVRTDRLDSRVESYRFAGASKSLEDGGDGTCYLVLFNDGTGQRTFSAMNTPANEKEDYHPDPMGYSYEYRWVADGSDGIIVTRTIVRKDNIGEETKAVDATYRINLTGGWYNAKTRPQSIIDFTYDLLRFQIDTEYGIKDIKKIASGEKLIESLGIKSALKSADSVTYDEALATLLMQGCDDGHTMYTSGSIFSGPAGITEALALSKKHLGPRYKELLANNEKFGQFRDTYFRSLGTPEETEKYFSLGKVLQKGLFTHESTAIIRFDAFNYVRGNNIQRMADIGVHPEWALEPYSVADTDNPLCFTVAFDKIAKDSKVKDVVIDLSNNGGGAIMCLPFLSAYFTDDPYYAVNDTAKGCVFDYHYKVDLNNDGKYGDVGDTYKGKYNFYILTSPFSFSCGNSLPGLAKSAGVKIIGQRSGGGTSSVAVYSDGSGSLYNFSSNNQMSAKFGDSYTHLDDGIAVDKEWAPSSDWYDPAKVHAFIQSMK